MFRLRGLSMFRKLQMLLASVLALSVAGCGTAVSRGGSEPLLANYDADCCVAGEPKGFVIPKGMAESRQKRADVVAEEEELEEFSGFLNISRKIRDKHGLRISVIGDSHIAADFFTDKLRKLSFADNSYGVGGVFPLQPKYHQNVVITSQGNGFEVISSRFSDTGYNGEFPAGGVMARAEKNGASIVYRSSLPLKDMQATFWVKGKPGDSFTVTGRNCGKSSYSVKTGRWEHFTASGMKFPVTFTAANKDSFIGTVFVDTSSGYVDSFGINGAQVNIFKRWNLEAFGDYLRFTKPDLVLLEYGANDALSGSFSEKGFEKDYLSAIDFISSNAPGAEIILMSPPTVAKFTQGIMKVYPEFDSIRKVIEKVADERGLLIFDMHDEMTRGGGKAGWVKLGLSKRDVHLTRDGYYTMGSYFYSALISFLNEI